MRAYSCNKSVFSYLRTLTTRHCAHLLTARRCCGNRLISVTGSKPAARSYSGRMGQVDRRTDRRTNGWTPYRFIDPAPHTMRAVPITVVQTCTKINDGIGLSEYGGMTKFGFKTLRIGEAVNSPKTHRDIFVTYCKIIP